MVLIEMTAADFVSIRIPLVRYCNIHTQ